MSYRDQQEAARRRREALEAELNELRARSAGLEEMRERAHEIERTLAAIDEEVARARARTKLPLLASVKVASPCHERWGDMTGDERARHCGRCDKTVYDLSALTAAQAESLLRDRGEAMCVRFYRRGDGTVMTSDCPVGARRARVRSAVIAVAAAAVAVPAIGAAFMHLSEPVMGELAIETPPPDVAVMGLVALPQDPSTIDVVEKPGTDEPEVEMGRVAGPYHPAE